MRSLLIAATASLIAAIAPAYAKPMELWQTTGLKA